MKLNFSSQKPLFITGVAVSLLSAGAMLACASPEAESSHDEPQGEVVQQPIPYDIDASDALPAHGAGAVRERDGAYFLDGDIDEEAEALDLDSSIDTENFSGNPPTDNRSARSSNSYGNAHPYALVGLIQSSTGTCTGFLVGERIVMTAAHCIGHAGHWATNVKFTPRYDPVRYPAVGSTPATGPWGTFTAGGKIVPTAWSNCQNATPGANACQPYDKGWLVLDKAPNIGFFGVVSLASSTPYGKLKTLGYPGDKSPRIQYYAETSDWKNPPSADKSWRWAYNDWTNIFTGLDFVGGQSGSPIWSNFAPYDRWWITAVGTASGGYPGGTAADPNNKWPTLLARIDPGDIQVIGDLRAQNP